MNSPGEWPQYHDIKDTLTKYQITKEHGSSLTRQTSQNKVEDGQLQTINYKVSFKINLLISTKTDYIALMKQEYG